MAVPVADVAAVTPGDIEYIARFDVHSAMLRQRFGGFRRTGGEPRNAIRQQVT